MGCCQKLAAPVGLSPLTLVLSLHPFSPSAAVPIGLSPPSALALPIWPNLTSHSPCLFLAFGQVRPGGHPHTGGGEILPNGGCWALGFHLRGHFPDGDTLGG